MRGYLGNPLVFCGCVGLLPHGRHPTEPHQGDLVVALGGRTGSDGIHGATFSSAELTHETSETAGSAVQIGDPITEKGLIELIEAARDEALYTAITDCGAGGFSSSVGEMAETLETDVELTNVKLKYPGLTPWEIWLSEAQERLVIAVPQPTYPASRNSPSCGMWK
ncbi:MAG: AIR synthase-related protein [Caldilineaceae bacterium]